MIEKRRFTFVGSKINVSRKLNGMNYKKTVHSEPVEIEFVKCDFPGCTREAPITTVIDNLFWGGHKGKTFCKFHFESGKFLLNQNPGKLWVTHKIENVEKVLGEIVEMLFDGHYKVQWYFDGKKLSDPTEIYHASVLNLLPFEM